MFGLSKTARLYIFTTFTFSFMLVEWVVGITTAATSLQADAIHMLSDVMSSVIAIIGIRLTQRTRVPAHLGFGYARSEIVAALINSVFLLALCFSIFTEAIQRYFEPHPIEDPKMVLIVGSIGLGVNIIGLVLFHDVAHNHGPGSSCGGHSHDHDHGHDHGHGHKHSHKHSHDVEKGHSHGRRGSDCTHISFSSASSHQHCTTEDRAYMHPSERRRSLIHLASHLQRRDSDAHSHGSHDSHDHDHDHGHSHDHGHGHNMRGVFLHVLGDALGSVAVIISALILIFASEWEGKRFVDPTVTLIFTGLLVYFTLPLVKATCLILLQSTPANISLSKLRRRLMRVPDVDSLHDLHVWQLAEGKVVGSVHARVRDPTGMGRVTEARLRNTLRLVERVFCDTGIHSVTVQLEVWDPRLDAGVPIDACLGRCARRCDAGSRCCTPPSGDKEEVATLADEDKDGGMLLHVPEDADDDRAWKEGARVTGFFHGP